MELQILDAFAGLHNPVLDKIMYVITSLGNAGIIWIILCLLLLLIPKTRQTGVFLMAALLVDLLLCNGIIKPLFQRTRPYEVNTAVQLLISRPVDYSFPSGHTAASFASAAALYLSGAKKMAVPALILACLIAFSRMYFYVHYPTDIVGGIAVGVLSAYLGNRIVKRFGHNI